MRDKYASFVTFIRDMLTICETLADFAPAAKDPDVLTEYVRQKLSRSIVNSLTDENDSLTVLTVETRIEDAIRESLQKTDQGIYLNLEPNLAQRLVEAVQAAAEKAINEGYQPVILCSPVVRRHLWKLLSRFVSQIVVLSNAELAGRVNIQSLGTIEINPRKK